MSVYKSSLLLLCLTSIRSTKIDNSTETESNNPICTASTNSKAIVDSAINDCLHNNKTTVSEDFLELQTNFDKAYVKLRTRKDAFTSGFQAKLDEANLKLQTKEKEIHALKTELDEANVKIETLKTQLDESEKTKRDKIRALKDELETVKDELFSEQKTYHRLKRQLEHQNRDGAEKPTRSVLDAARSLQSFARPNLSKLGQQQNTGNK